MTLPALRADSPAVACIASGVRQPRVDHQVIAERHSAGDRQLHGHVVDRFGAHAAPTARRPVFQVTVIGYGAVSGCARSAARTWSSARGISFACGAGAAGRAGLLAGRAEALLPSKEECGDGQATPARSTGASSYSFPPSFREGAAKWGACPLNRSLRFCKRADKSVRVNSFGSKRPNSIVTGRQCGETAGRAHNLRELDRARSIEHCHP